MHVEDIYVVVYAELCYMCIIISSGDQIFYIEYTAKTVQCLLSHPIGIGLEASKVADSCNLLKKRFRNTRVR
jgi:hypothetical protein